MGKFAYKKKKKERIRKIESKRKVKERLRRERLRIGAGKLNGEEGRKEKAYYES